MSSAEFRAKQKAITDERNFRIKAEYRELKKTLSQYGAFDLLANKYGKTIDTIRHITFLQNKEEEK